MGTEYIPKFDVKLRMELIKGAPPTITYYKQKTPQAIATILMRNANRYPRHGSMIMSIVESQESRKEPTVVFKSVRGKQDGTYK